MKIQIQNETWDEKRCWDWMIQELKKLKKPRKIEFTFIMSQQQRDLLNDAIQKGLERFNYGKRNKTTNRRSKYKRI